MGGSRYLGQQERWGRFPGLEGKGWRDRPQTRGTRSLQERGEGCWAGRGLRGVMSLSLTLPLSQVEHDPPDSECLLPSNQE